MNETLTKIIKEKNTISIQLELDYKLILNLIKVEFRNIYIGLVEDLLNKRREDLKNKFGKISIEDFRKQRDQIDREFIMVKIEKELEEAGD